MTRHPPRRSRAAEIATGLASLLLLVALVAGLPAALYAVGGSPIPHVIPGWHQVTTTLASHDTGTLLIAVIRDIAWLAWAAFTISAAIEILAQARGKPTARLRGLGSVQFLARALVSSVAVAFSAPGALLAVPAAFAATAPAAAQLTAAQHPAAMTEFTVRPGDCLWTIARHYLGNGDRYGEIADLNYGRDMGGGQRFTDPALIQPGWVLWLPAAAAHSPGPAAAPGSHPGHDGHPSRHQHYAVPHPAATAPSAMVTAPSGSASATPPVSSGPPAWAQPQASGPPAGQAHGGQHGLPAVEVFTAGLLSGGIITTLAHLRHRQRQQRRPGRRIALPATGGARRAERSMRAAPAAARPATLQAALAALAEGLRGQGAPLPPIAGVHFPGGELEVLLTAAAPRPPAPFQPAPGTQDMCWGLDAAELARLSPGGSGDVLPGLVSAGTTDAGGQLLIDLEAPGVTTVDGPPDLIDRLLVTAAAELATNPWSGTFDLLLTGFPELAAASSRAQECRSLDQAITIMEDRARQITAAAAGTPPRQNRLTDPASPDWTLTLLAARTAPTSEQMARILDVAQPGSGIAALLPGDVTTPDGREAPASLDLSDDPAGNGQVIASLHPLGLTVRPQLLDDPGYTALAEIFAAAQAGDVSPADPPYRDLLPPPEPVPAPPGDGAPNGQYPAPPPLASVPPAAAEDTGPTHRKGLRIGILGPFTLTGSDEDLQPKQAELVLALALAGPAGLSNSALCTMLGPDEDHPKPPDSLRQIITRTRRKLGTTPDGSEYIIHAGNAQYILDPAAELDWHAFQRLTETGRAGHDRAQLRAALSLLRGHPLDGIYHWWLEPALIETIRAEIVDTAELLAQLELAAGGPAAAGRAARAGLSADTAAEQLWRALMRADDAAGNTAGVYEAWRRCLDAIADIAADGEPHPDTTALYHELTRRPTPAGHH